MPELPEVESYRVPAERALRRPIVHVEAPDAWFLGGRLVVRDPRRLGGVLLDPGEAVLGPDAMTVTPAGLRSALSGSAAPLKARLMDQSRLAGVGNLLADETLWRAGLDQFSG